MKRRRFLTSTWVILAEGLSVLKPFEGESQEKSATAVYMSDLGKARPRSALSVSHQKGKWQVLGYKTMTREGRMLLTDPESEAAELRLSLNLSGWHALYVGMPGIDIDSAYVKLRLSGSRDFRIFQLNPSAYGFVEEGFWEVADLTGQELVIAQAGIGKSTRAGVLGYVKCVPLKTEEVGWWRMEQASLDTKRLVAFNDGHEQFHSGLMRSPDDIRMWIEPLKGTDFGRLVWGALDMDIAQYPAKVATTFGAGVASFDSPGDRLFAEILEEFRNRGQNPLEIARDAAHEAGLKISFAARMNYLKPPPWDEVFGKFFWDHPDLWLLQRDGSPGGLAFSCLAVSYASDQVQNRMREVLKEIAQFSPDGIHLLYTRFPPFVGYEDAAVDPFRRLFGVSPNDLPEDDPRWLDFKAEIMTGFMRKLRSDLDQMGVTLGHHIELSASVDGREADLRSAGIDVPAWMRLGLLDWVIPYPSVSCCEGSREGWKTVEAEKFVRWAMGTKCMVYAEMQGVSHEVGVKGPERNWDEQAAHFYKAGCEGLSFWDNDGDATLSRTWNKMRWLGHRRSLLSGQSIGRYREVTRDKFKGTTVYRLRDEADLNQGR